MQNQWITGLRARAVRTAKQLQTKTKTIYLQKLTEYFQYALEVIRGFFVHLPRVQLVHVGDHRPPKPVDRRHLGLAVSPYIGLMMIAIFALIGNQSNRRALAAPSLWESDVAGIDPEQVAQILEAVDPLTPEIIEDPEGVASLLLVDEGAYVSRPDSAVLEEAATLSKKDPIPYVVREGDTMLSIAKQNGRTVATILDANGIKPEDAGKIKPGQTLLVPQEDTSHSLAWLEADHKARAEAAAAAAKKLAAQQAQNAKKKGLLASLATSKEQASGGFNGTPTTSLIIPINHNGISRGLSRGHTGIDYRANVGTKVAAAAAGRVIEITHGWAGGWGNSILLDNGKGMTSRYAHLSNVAVGIGETLGQGQVLGYSGNTGRSTGPHLHFEVRINGRAINPF